MSARTWFTAAVAVTAFSCTVPGDDERSSSVASAIVHGTESDATQDATVLVMHYDALSKGEGAASACTGTLLAPRLVLTARHCVALTDPTAACDAQGNALAGGVVESDREPSTLYVFSGNQRPNFITGTARPSRGKEIVSSGAKTLCNNDIALLVLDRDLAGAKISPIRLDAKPTKGEVVTVVGWGIAENDPNPETRRQRADVPVVEVGPAEGLAPSEFRIGEGTCQGDSGGPAIAPSGAVLGALSRGGNGSGGGGVDGCLGGTNIFTSVAGHADLVRAAYARVGQEPWLEGQPNPQLAKPGEACVKDDECRSNLCDGARNACADACSDGACAEGFACVDEGGRKLCAPRNLAGADPPGCSLASAPGSDGRASVVVIACVLLAANRRRRRFA